MERRKDLLVLPQPLNEISEKAKAITTTLRGFIVKDRQPYVVVKEAGFEHIIRVLEPPYNIPSCCLFRNT